MKLHGYFRSSASYRVRIALNLKGLSAEQLTHHLRKGEQREPSYLAINPQGLVPSLQDDHGAILTQSLAIIEWLDEIHPEPPLLPNDPLRRAHGPIATHRRKARNNCARPMGRSTPTCCPGLWPGYRTGCCLRYRLAGSQIRSRVPPDCRLERDQRFQALPGAS